MSDDGLLSIVHELAKQLPQILYSAANAYSMAEHLSVENFDWSPRSV